jgi:hypothetical protein
MNELDRKLQQARNEMIAKRFGWIDIDPRAIRDDKYRMLERPIPIMERTVG